MIKLRNIITTLAVSILPFSVGAQTTVQVVTKKIEKTFPYRTGYDVNVEGEKAEMRVETWDRNEVHVVLELVAKHPDRAVAERDLEFMQYLADRVQRRIYLRNYVRSPEDQPKSESVFEARYHIRVPEDCPVYLKDYFGNIDVRQLTNRLKIRSEFSTVGLSDLRGDIDVNTRFGDLHGQRIEGSMIIASQRSNITLREVSGSYDIEAQYGVVEIFANELTSLNIRADKSNVFLHNVHPEQYSYNLTAQNGSITTPSTLAFEQTRNLPNLQKMVFKPTRELYPAITVSVSFGDIVVD